MTREEFKAEMAEKKERAEARINSALQTFADMIIARMEAIEASSWKKGWTDGEAMIGLPQNVTGRVYTGSNAFLCQLDTTLKNYKVPVYFTIKQIKDLGAFPKKGEKSIPIFKWGLSIYNRETGKKATLKEYDSLSKEERDEKYKVIPYLKIFNEWNIDQTNLEEVNKEKYDALLSKFEAKEIKDDNGMYSNAAIDQMLTSQSWVCPIEYTQQNPSALYNKSRDVIIVPRKDQFNISDTPEEIYKDGEEYYSSLIHEMAHSTGHESRLNRLSPDGKFGGEEYAKEELVAELTAAMVGSALGFDSRIRDNNTAYLKSWMSALKKEPKFLLSVMSDVNKASAMVIEHIDEERVKLGQKALLEGNLDGLDEKAENEKQFEAIKNGETIKEQNNNIKDKDKKIFYSNLSDTSDIDLKEDPQQLAAFYENGDKQSLFDALKQAQKESGASWNLATLESTIGENAEIIAEDEKHIAVKYPYYIPGTFFMYEKVTEQQILDKIQQQGLSKDDSEVAHQIGKEAIKKQFDNMSDHSVEMPDGTVFGVDYNKEKDTLDVLITNGAGKQEIYSTNYDHDRSIKGNLGYVWEELSNMKQYQAKEVKQETSSKTAKDSGDKEPEINDKEDNSVPIEEGKGDLTPKEYFSTLMDSITDGQHDDHTALGIKNISELRDYFKDNSHVNEWMEGASNRELIEAGADKLPNIRYPHKEGRTLYDMEAAYSNINSKYEDVTDDRTRQITHRIDQAKSIITAYQTNIENAHGEDYLFEEESAHKIIPRAEYAASISQEQAATSERSIDESYHYSFARFESSERTKAFDSYRESGDHEALLHLAEIMDVNNLIELNKVRKNAPKTSEDKVLVENSSYAVTYNQQNSTYDLLRKIEKEKVLELIGDINDNDEIKASSDDVQKLAYEDAAQQMAEFAEREPRFFTMPNREVLDFQYNAESNQIEVGKMTSEGMDLQYTFDYDLSSSPEHNLSIVHDDLAGLEEFRMLSVEEIEQREKIALSWRNTDNKLEMPSGDVLTVEYDKEKDTLNVAYTTEDGKPEIYSTKYNHEGSTTKNVRDLWQKFANMKQYQSTKEASPEKENKEKASATQEKKGEVYYYSYAYLQSTDDTQEFDDLQKKGDYKQILQQAQMYDQGDALEQSKTFKNAKKYGNEDILDEDDHYAVVYNNSLGGTYELLRKETKEEVLDNIDRYGLEQDASEDVKKVAYESVAKQFSEIKAQIPAFTMPNNEVLYFQYNQEKNQVEVGHVTNIGLMKEHTFDYDVNQTLDANLEAINESLQENEEYQAMEEEEEAESLDEDNQVKVPREDSNIETDVAGMAKQFVAEGMSMEEAEQKAKSIAEKQQHQKYHDEEKQKDAEQKQQQKKKEEQAKKEEEKKPVSHAALLFAALGLASEKNGVWMNRAQRQPAEFIHSHTPVTAYNSIMMTLNTDANKYKTNVYTFYKSAAENNLPVKRNEESLRFNWVNWDYQHMMNHDDIITQKKYDTLSDEEKSFYAKHASRVEQHIYNVDQTIMNAKDHEAYGNLVKTKGAPFVKAEEKTISVLQQYNDYQKKHPDIVVLNKTGDSYEIYGEKASDVAKILNLEVEKKKMDGKKVDLVSFPSQHLDTYLPKIIRAGNRVSIVDNLKEKKVSIPVQDNTAILNKAYSTAKAVADQSGMKYERIMVVQDAKYDKVDDKIVVSGMSEKTADENHATLYKANDIYRAVVAAVGSEERLDRSGRNSYLPEDDAKHEKLVQELAAGVLMTRQGLPAILSKESEKLVPYWQRELTENPKMLGVLERDVNNAVETIDSILAKRKVDYKAIRGQMPGKILTENPERFSISSSLAKLPSMETKEMVVVLDKKHKTADIILPAGASLQVDNEVPGMNKKRIKTALGKMGVKEVSFYNAGGGLSLHESNDYYKGKEVTVSKLKQYELLTQQTVDLKDKFAPKKEVKITTFEALPDDMGRYAFFIKAENEPAFAVYPNKEHVNQFYSSLKSENRAVVHNALARKYYELGTKHPDARVDVITLRKVNIGDAKIDRICITAKHNDPKQHIIFATVNGERMHAPVSKAQWNKMWLAEDMSDYKQRLAAVIFEPFIKKEVKNDVSQQASEKTEETVKPDSPAPEPEQEEKVERTLHR
ncbi:zincin-like metallopeptidase domain-containing protein [Segatella copri]|nr:zincin-like metallopeptidase domain-containing protein [Segatella copri]